MNDPDASLEPAHSRWMEAVAPHRRPALRRSVWQMVNSIVPYFVLWGLMIASLQVSYALTLLLAVLAAGFLVRIFIIFHDCGHGSFFATRRANRIGEFVTGLLVFTPYRQWRRTHALHHATSGDLDRRGTGEVWTLTVHEYLEAPWHRRLAYRLTRNPVVLFAIAPWYLFLIHNRFPSFRVRPRDRRGVYWTNLALLGIVAAMSLTIGLEAYLLIQLPSIMLAATAGVWLFYVQHQFEGVQWRRHETWDYAEAALEGSSYYKLPRVLQWFTGNIGFHHIHHLSPAIPNYNLERCHRENAMFHQVPEITLLGSLKSFGYRLWDERAQRLVGYRGLRAARRRTSRAARG